MDSRLALLLCVLGSMIFPCAPRALATGIEQIDLRVEGMT
jgi:hypothetical protein